MDYQKIYSQLILKAKKRDKVQGYREVHHIIPKCVKGSDDPSNLVQLTAKEHFVAHLLLTEIYPKSQKLKYALWMMASMEAPSQNRYKVSANMYKLIKEQISKKSMEHKQKISESLKKAYAEGTRISNAGKKMPKEFGEKISRAKKGMVGTNLGKSMTEDQKYKISETLKGHKVSEYTKSKISQTLKNRKK
jgi:hypothetical protein